MMRGRGNPGLGDQHEWSGRPLSGPSYGQVASRAGFPLRSGRNSREAEMAAEATQALAQFAAALRYDDIPPRVRDHSKTLFLDALASPVPARLPQQTGHTPPL